MKKIKEENRKDSRRASRESEMTKGQLDKNRRMEQLKGEKRVRVAENTT